MCQFASLLFHVPSLEFAVSNLLSHSKTFEALNLSEQQGWREAHYLPSGEIGCRTIDGDSVSPEAAAKVLREQFPTFPGFLSWALSHGASLEDREKEGGRTVAHEAACCGHLPSGETEESLLSAARKNRRNRRRRELRAERRVIGRKDNAHA